LPSPARSTSTPRTPPPPRPATSERLTGFVDLGYISEDGVVLGMPDAGDTTSIKAWQNGATVRVLRSAPDDNPTLQLTLIETSLATHPDQRSA
jgi:hypothetical protein